MRIFQLPAVNIMKIDVSISFAGRFVAPQNFINNIWISSPFFYHCAAKNQPVLRYLPEEVFEHVECGMGGTCVVSKLVVPKIWEYQYVVQ